MTKAMKNIPMRLIVLLVALFAMFGDVYSQTVRCYYSPKKKTLMYSDINWYDSSDVYSIGAENGGIEFVYEDDEGEKKIFSSFGASQCEFSCNDTCSVFSVYSFFASGLGSCSEIVCIDEDGLPCRPDKSEAELVFHFKLNKGVFSCVCSFIKRSEFTFLDKLPTRDKLFESPFYYQDFLYEVVIHMMNEGYDNAYILQFLKDFDVELRKSEAFKIATSPERSSEYLYPSHYFFMKNIYSILLPVADKELSIDQFMVLSKELEHVFDEVIF